MGTTFSAGGLVYSSQYQQNFLDLYYFATKHKEAHWFLEKLIRKQLYLFLFFISGDATIFSLDATLVYSLNNEGKRGGKLVKSQLSQLV